MPKELMNYQLTKIIIKMDLVLVPFAIALCKMGLIWVRLENKYTFFAPHLDFESEEDW